MRILGTGSMGFVLVFEKLEGVALGRLLFVESTRRFGKASARP